MISKTMALLGICTALFAFSAKPGGEGFEIYLNNKVVLQQYGNDVNTVKSLQLPQASPDDKLVIKYHHCGRVGKNRIVTIRDGENKTLKEFRFADVATPVSGMEIKLREITGLKKGTGNLRLYYSSTELPKGRMLASLNTNTNLTKL